MMFVMSHPIIDYGFTVASFTAVAYDWGEQDNTYQGGY